MKRGRKPTAPEVVAEVRRLRDRVDPDTGEQPSWGEIGKALGIPRQTARSAYNDVAGLLRMERTKVTQPGRRPSARKGDSVRA